MSFKIAYIVMAVILVIQFLTAPPSMKAERVTLWLILLFITAVIHGIVIFVRKYRSKKLNK